MVDAHPSSRHEFARGTKPLELKFGSKRPEAQDRVGQIDWRAAIVSADLPSQQRTNVGIGSDKTEFDAAIRGHVRLDCGEMRFLVKWTGSDHSTWEPKSRLPVTKIEEYMLGIRAAS